MLGSRKLGRLLLAATPLALAGCVSNSFLVCADTSASLEGAWSIATVNGEAIPPGGLAIPGSSDRSTSPDGITFTGNLPNLGGLTVVFRRVP